MKITIEKLNQNLSNIDLHLAPIASIAEFLIESGTLEKLTEQVPEIVALLRKHFPVEGPKFFMSDVIDYLGISKRTYYRKLAEGKLKPRKWEGPDFFYRHDLAEEYRESKRRGRI